MVEQLPRTPFPLGDKENLAGLMRSMPDWTTRREQFFSVALLPYYDAGLTWEGMDRDVGHIIYKLTDLVERSDRKAFAVYPSSDGSLRIAHEDVDGSFESQWDSLEDWRKKWERNHSNIPDYDIVQDFIRQYLHK